MSFDINSKNLSNIQASAKSCPGGGGNTGYFARGKKNDEEEVLQFKTETTLDDSFEKYNVDDTQKDDDLLTILKNLVLDIIEAIKNLFTK